VVQVKELYRYGVFTVDTGATLAGASRRMIAHGVGSLAVLEDGELAGIVTERDLAQAVADQVDPATTPVADYLSAEPASTTPDQDAEEAARRMLDLGVRHLPVVDGGKVVGMLSVRDVLVLTVWPPASKLAP
jgi:CBS domain-containing protein